MINASQAADASKAQLDKMIDDLKASIVKVISASIAQGSCKATFYPRNQFEGQNALELLAEYGYSSKVHVAKDQRDSDRIDIFWG